MTPSLARRASILDCSFASLPPTSGGTNMKSLLLAIASLLTCASALAEEQPVRVFIFAGQSNMVGSDSKVEDIKNFPPFVGLDEPQPKVRFSYCIGRENKTKSDGWVPLAPIKNIVGPELSFARDVSKAIDAPIAIIKVAAGGTHLGGDWNPDNPAGFKMYPLALKVVRESLAALKKEGIEFRVEGFMWHQGENDMFEQDYMANYGKYLKNYLARWRDDLDEPKLKFYIGELCTKTIWGMDLRPRMYKISLGQKSVTNSDPLATYVPTSHVGVEIGNPVGLHYHYGTLGQLEHGVNYAHAYLESIEKLSERQRELKEWPYKDKEKIKLFVLAGHRNMEGERAFTDQIRESDPDLLKDNHSIAYRYDIAAGCKKANGWEPLGPVGLYQNFGPELSFARLMQEKEASKFAIAKFTDSGSQIIDWTPEGSEQAPGRHVYPRFIRFIKESVEQLEAKGQEVELAGIFYHVGENDMSFMPFRKGSAERIKSIIEQSRVDLGMKNLKWFVSQQPPTDKENLNKFDPVAPIAQLGAQDELLIHIKAFDLPTQPKRLVLDSRGIVALGTQLAEAYSAE